ncbi:MAG: ABC transporter permease subunit [Candidatus Ornithospirochaeta sp.]
MNVYKRELKAGMKGFWIWTLSVAAFIAICIFMFPEMKGNVESVSELFASMGAFSSAFGMDRLGLGTLLGFYSVECGTIMALGAALFAAMMGSVMVGKEEKGRTAEFIFSLPIKREKVMMEKYLALITEMVVFHIICFSVSLLSILMIKEEIPMKELLLLHSSFLILTVFIATICFSLSTVLSLSNVGTGMGIVLILYFLSITANITEKADWIKYLTPFSFTEGADIVLDKKLDWILIIIWLFVSLLFLLYGFWNYKKRDLKS